MTAPTIEKISKPGVYDLPAEQYHADPVEGGSLSTTGARMLLPPSCPAKFKYWRDNPEEHKADYDFGHAAHELVLGRGPGIVVVKAKDWRTNAAKDAREQAYADGKAPLLEADYQIVLAMAAALRAHPHASKLLAPDSGGAEQTMVWRDERTGVMRRALVDHLPHNATLRGRYVLPDYKTAKSAAPEAIRKAIADYGYHIQGDTYLSGMRALGIDDAPAFVLVVQEKTPPYLVTIAEPDRDALRIGAKQNREALELYAECVANDHWPGYSSEVELLPLPTWYENQFKEPW